MTRSEFERATEAQAEHLVKLVRANAPEYIKALVGLLQDKSDEYAFDDPFGSWRKRGVAGQIVRVEDKMQRWDSFIRRGGVPLETWLETFGDIVGYAICAAVWVQFGDDPLVTDKDEHEGEDVCNPLPQSSASLRYWKMRRATRTERH